MNLLERAIDLRTSAISFGRSLAREAEVETPNSSRLVDLIFSSGELYGRFDQIGLDAGLYSSPTFAAAFNANGVWANLREAIHALGTDPATAHAKVVSANSSYEQMLIEVNRFIGQAQDLTNAAA